MATDLLVVETEKFRGSLHDLNAALIQAATLAMRAAVRETESSARGTHLFKDKTGETRGSIKAEVQSFRSGFVSAGGAAQLLEWGTRPHVIRGNPFLRFVVNGETFIRRMVHHPGTKPTHFMSEARARGAQALEYGLEFYMNAAIRRI